MRLGVVGGGLIAQIAHLPALTALSRQFDVVALADPSERVRDVLARRYGIARTFATHEELIDRAGLDAVLVASPNGTHARVTLDALEAGLHVLVEKPLCLAADDAAAIVADAERRRLVVQVGYMKRFDGAYEALREELPEPGELELIDTATVDPGIGETYRPADFVAPADADPSAERELRRCTEEQVARRGRLGRPAARQAVLRRVPRCARARRQPRARAAGRISTSSRRGHGRRERRRRFARVRGVPARRRGAHGPASGRSLPGASAFSEELRVHAADGVRRLAFAAPYDASAPSRLEVAETRAPVRPRRAKLLEPARPLPRLRHDRRACRTPAAQGARDVALLTDLYRAAMAA